MSVSCVQNQLALLENVRTWGSCIFLCLQDAPTHIQSQFSHVRQVSRGCDGNKSLQEGGG